MLRGCRHLEGISFFFLSKTEDGGKVVWSRLRWLKHEENDTPDLEEEICRQQANN
jgi:hypothetical protein